jgi:two-component system, LytTR family, sensor kinase
MKFSISRERVYLYLWFGFAWFLLWEVHNLVSFPDQFGRRTINEIWRDSYILALPFVTRKRKYLLTQVLIGAVCLFIMLMFYSYGLYAWRESGIRLGIYTPYRFDKTVSHAISYHMQFAVASTFIFGVVRHIYYYTKLKRAAQQLRIEKQEAELNYLRSQTNPHFLFNTLNNIYSLARDKSDLAPESILRLSKILRFMLYETSGDYIAIEQELKIISDYIALEKLRYDDSLRINFNHDIEDMKQALPPLLLIPLVENAFKHGVSETRDHPFVDIHLSVSKRQLKFVVKNSAERSMSENIVKENIGLSNLRRQLELLYTDHELVVRQDGSAFTATLKINLGTHV